MLKPTFYNILFYLFIKYIAFYLYLAFKNNDFYFFEVSNMKYFMYWWMLLFLPIVIIFIFSAPIYFSLKIKSPIYFMLLMGAILVAEYFVYVFFTSDKHVDMNGVYNGIISVLFLLLFFFKHIRLIFSVRPGF